VQVSAGLTHDLGSSLELRSTATAGYLRRRTIDGDQAGDAGSSAVHRTGYYSAMVGLSFADSTTFAGSLLYRGTGGFATSPGLAEAFASLPEHQLRGWAGYRLDPSFRLGAALLLKSSVEWEANRGEGQTGYVPPMSRLDLTIEKSLWGGRVRTQLVVSNALRTAERHHPAGADFAFRYFVGAEMSLPPRSLAAS
jgi:hypothetical protein